MRKNYNMTQSEESITLMIPYRLPYHGSRSFAGDPNDALLVTFLSADKKEHP